MKPETYKKTTEIIIKMIDYFGKDVKRINHALKVNAFARIIASSEKISEEEDIIIQYSSILHDIGIKNAEKKYGSAAGKYQEIEGPKIAGQILAEAGVAENIIERVCFITGRHHSYNKIDGPDFQIIAEADFIVNIYEDNMRDDAVKSVYNKIFKTDSGKKLLREMYG
ncbi:MAG: HD family phosphohydrolase [Spirochaetes bacterium GWF1_41_5]|nr:MAG: HD family phosphohydrolase [Spirochaetes bacterium GWF1_41_5]HBE02187.1 HD family phosphohydrolase [Spirochaetia bacterium]